MTDFKEDKPDVLKLGSLLEAQVGTSHKHRVISLHLEAEIPCGQKKKIHQFQCRLSVEQAKWLGEFLTQVADEISVKLN